LCVITDVRTKEGKAPMKKQKKLSYSREGATDVRKRKKPRKALTSPSTVKGAHAKLPNTSIVIDLRTRFLRE
jgi:hypothetical protein